MSRLTPEKLREIQALLEAKGLRSSASARIERRSEEGPRALSFAQERLWFFARMAPESPVFSIPAAWRIEGGLDRERLERAVARVVARHGALRTRFVVEDGRAKQIVAGAEEVRLPVEVVVADGENVARRREVALARARELAREPIGLAEPPLARVVLFEIAPTEHLLLVVLHHIVSEVQSVAIFARDLAEAYRTDADLEPLDLDFTDFAAWQRERVEGKRGEKELAFWKEKLEGHPGTLDLPTDRPRPPVQSFEGSTRTRALAEGLAERARRLAREAKVTPFTVTAAVWAMLLGRLGASEDLLIGVPVTDRNRAELADLIGFFVNTLTLRVDLTGDPSFREVLRRVNEFHLDAQSHQELPFDRLVEELGVDRDLSKSPLFQTAFLYQTTAESGPAVHVLADGVQLVALDDPLAVHTGTSKFDAALVVWDRGSSMDVSIEYATDLFDAETVDRMLEHFELLLAAALDDLDRPIDDLDLLLDVEREELARWNETDVELESETRIEELFERVADATPELLAVEGDGISLTYGECETRANQLAHRLRALGVRRDEPVAVATGRTPDMIIAILGVLKAGGAYLSVDLSHPAERIDFEFADAGVRLVISTSAAEAALPRRTEIRRILLDVERESLSAEPMTRPEREGTTRDLAYVIYTSGSTGRPKGVALEHLGLLNLSAWHRRTYEVSPRDRATHLAGLAFDASVWEVWPYLTAGASLHLVPEDVRLSPDRLIAWMAEHRITQSFLPTPLCEALVHGAGEGTLPKDLALEVVLTGGDRFRRAPRHELPFRLVNHYGPTENTVVATATPIRCASEETGAAPPIGRPIDNVRVYVLDARGRPVPIGVPGELYIGGSSLARGYVGREDWTAERFPASDLDPGGRLYRTGDLVRWRRDGELDFLGRLDGQVKVRGFRIELGEIEAQLGAMEAVRECAVVVREGPGGDGVLVAYVESDGAFDAETIRTHLASVLPEYMIPTRIVRLETMPLSPSGKIDRKALPEVDLSETSEEIVDPAGEVEERLAAAWRDLLGLERVGTNMNFFEVGGHSILLAQLHARLVDDGFEGLGIVELFRYPTIASLAAHLANEDDGAGIDTAAAAKDRGAKRRAALGARRRKGAR